MSAARWLLRRACQLKQEKNQPGEISDCKGMAEQEKRGPKRLPSALIQATGRREGLRSLPVPLLLHHHHQPRRGARRQDKGPTQQHASHTRQATRRSLPLRDDLQRDLPLLQHLKGAALPLFQSTKSAHTAELQCRPPNPGNYNGCRRGARVCAPLFHPTRGRLPHPTRGHRLITLAGLRRGRCLRPRKCHLQQW